MDSTQSGSVANGLSGFKLADDTVPKLVSAASKYEILEQLGKGGVGVVYRARDLKLKRDVAIKLLHSSLVGNSDADERFNNEAVVMSALQHPSIPHVFDSGRTKCGRPFLTMKLVVGTTLKKNLDDIEDKSARARIIHEVFARICEAVAYAHSQEMIHLDLKPQNIMVGKFGEVLLLDWGMARTITSPTSNTKPRPVPSSPVFGTLQYMAPEQATGQTVDKQTDVFCLGGILCEILTGRPPYIGENKHRVLSDAQSARLESAIIELTECGHHPTLVRLALRCLDPSRTNRPRDGLEVAQEVRSINAFEFDLAEKDMARFFELSLDLFCICSFDGFFRRINGNFSRVLGYSESELLSRPFLDFVVADDVERTKEVMGQLLEGKPVVRFRNRYRTSNGRVVDFEWTAKSIVDENVIFAVARNFSD